MIHDSVLVDSDVRMIPTIMKSVFDQMPKYGAPKTIVFIEEKPPRKLILEIHSCVSENMPDHIYFNRDAVVYEGVKFVVFSFSNKYGNVNQESEAELIEKSFQ